MNFLKKLISFILPPPEWRLPVIVLMGIFIGLGMYTFRISNAASYLSSKPETCINCHVMVPQYATWRRSSHAQVTKCVDCHVPHDSLLRKYHFKLNDGVRHSTIFTMRAEPQVIRIKEEGAAVVQENCIRCHTNALEDVALHEATYEDHLAGNAKLCWHCHREVPHGTVRSLSATPHTHVPNSSHVFPEWLNQFIPMLKKSWNRSSKGEML